MAAEPMNEIVKSLEQKLEKLLGQVSQLRADNQQLRADLKSARAESERVSKELATLKVEQNTQAGAVRDRLANLALLLDRLDQDLR